MIVFQHRHFILAVLTIHYVSFNEHWAQLVDEVSSVLYLRNIQAHSPQCIGQFITDLLQPPWLIHLGQLTVDVLQTLLELKHFCIFFINIFTYLGWPEMLQGLASFDQLLHGLFMHLSVSFHKLSLIMLTSVIAISLFLNFSSKATNFLLYYAT